CSAPKSASVLFAVGDAAVRREVLAGHEAAVAAVLDWIERHAHCRYRVDRKVCVFDAEGLTAAVFRQHTSRTLDPQLHTHLGGR
ncbi:MAG TPA: relaxase domain-containing protein, partial [bacterium]|nr:relaxase domain-containing protein [bacterium]